MNDLMTKSFTSYVDLKKDVMKDIDIEMGVATSMDKNMILFLEEAERVKIEMGEIRGVLGNLHKVNEDGKGLHKPEALKLLRSRINGDVVAVLKKARQIRSQLEDMDRANIASRRHSGCKEGTPIDRTRSAVTNGLRKKLKELMMEFQELRQRMMTEYNETIARRYFTVTGQYPNEEVIDRIVSSGDGLGGEDLLQRAVQEHGKGKVLETVVEIQDRYDTAKEIEKSLLELHQVFLDMAVMVEAQGEQLDDIHHHVINAASYVSGGTNNLKTAKGYQRSSRRCMVIGIILLLILVLVIVIPVAASLHQS